MIEEKIKKLLTSQAGIQMSARWLASKLKEKQPAVSRSLRKLTKAGVIRCQTKAEFDIEYSKKGDPIQCRRRRNYYWVESV